VNRVYFDHATAMSAVGKSIGFVLSLFCAGGAIAAGRHLVRRMLARQQQPSKPREGDQQEPAHLSGVVECFFVGAAGL
jgi:hypothetical protein